MDPVNGNGETKTVSSITKPSFFKVLVREFTSKLKIPPAFVKNFKGLIPPRVTIVSPAARSSWQVELEKGPDGLFFREGWWKFVEDNSLELGDFLIFKFDRKSKFFIRIYGRTACEKELPHSARRRNRKSLPSSSREERIRRSSSTEIKPERSSPVKEMRDQDVPPLIGEEDCYKSPSPKQEQHGGEGTVECTHPRFKIFISQRNLQQRYMSIPARFAKNYVGACSRTLQLQVGERMWSVRLCTYPSYSRFSQGWTAFMKDNNFRAGDVCVFEPIPGGGGGSSGGDDDDNDDNDNALLVKVSIYTELE